MSDEDVFEVEEEINNAFCELVIKLSESSFRPVIIEASNELMTTLLGLFSFWIGQHSLKMID